MLDTGAVHLIWTASENILINTLKVSPCTTAKYIVSGLGSSKDKNKVKSGKLCNKYRSNLRVGKLVYDNIEILASETTDDSFDLLIPACLLKSCVYTIDNENKKITILCKRNKPVYSMTFVDINGDKSVCTGFMEEVNDEPKDESKLSSKMLDFF